MIDDPKHSCIDTVDLQSIPAPKFGKWPDIVQVRLFNLGFSGISVIMARCGSVLFFPFGRGFSILIDRQFVGRNIETPTG